MAEMFDKQIIGSVADVYKKIDGQPDILLYTPTFQLIGVIAPCYDVHGTLKFNDNCHFLFLIVMQERMGTLYMYLCILR